VAFKFGHVSQDWKNNFAGNIGSRIDFEDIGNHNMKGIAGTWQLFLVPD
jgi:hypothetical protein